MNIKLYPTACLNEVGKRENNEDSIYPKAGRATRDSRLFMVCDGVGGSAKGEQASKLACESFVAYCQQMSNGFPQPLNDGLLPDAAYINAALQYTEAAFDAHLAANADSKNMGTTVTLLCLHESGITAAHIGDSRIYHVREGKIMWCTSDHSLVNDYLKAGILTPEDAVNHPQKNVITRALQGASVRPTRADVHIITDVAADDFIFMCSDGILESISDDDLCRILGDSRLAVEDQIAQIHNHCSGNSRDNFSCYLLKIASVEGSIIRQYGLAQTQTKPVENTANNEKISIELDDAPRFTLTNSTPDTTTLPMPQATNTQNTTETAAKTSNSNKFIPIALGIIIIGILGFVTMNYFKKPNKPNKKHSQEEVLPQPKKHNYTVVETPVRPQNTVTTSKPTLPTAHNPPTPAPKPLPPAATAQAEAIISNKPVPVPPKVEPEKPKPAPKKMTAQEIFDATRKKTEMGPQQPPQ
jgi:serine/threonine protein phosphatase PrpC